MFSILLYASQGERAWIENIDQQYQERPIPNFYKLAGKSTKVDMTVQDEDLIPLEENLNIQLTLPMPKGRGFLLPATA